MGIKRVVLASVVLCACGPKAKPADGPGDTAEAKLCVDPATAQGDLIGPSDGEAESQPWTAIDNDPLPAIEAGWNLMAIVDGDGAQYAVVAAEGCDMGNCDPHLLRVVDGAIAERATLPYADTIPQEDGSPFGLDWLAVVGDEVWLTYSIVGSPEPAIGSTLHQYTAVFGAADLATRWSAEESTYPEADSLEFCRGEEHALDADCDGDQDLLLTVSCTTGECVDVDGVLPEGCPAPMVTHTVYARGADGAYTERK